MVQLHRMALLVVHTGLENINLDFSIVALVMNNAMIVSLTILSN